MRTGSTDSETARPDLIVNTINGSTNKALFSALREAGITAAETPVLSFAIGYNAVHLWAQAVREAGTFDPAAVRAASLGASIESPGGFAYIDEGHGHAWQSLRVGRVRSDGQRDVVWAERAPVGAQPWGSTRDKATWETLLAEMYAGWGDSWEAPAAP